MITNKQSYARGTRGLIFTAYLEGKKVIIKETNPKASINTLGNEASKLQAVNKKNIGPEFISYDGVQLIMEYVEGPEILKWAKLQTPEKILAIFTKLLDQCRILDTMNLSKNELHRPYKHVIIRDGVPVQLDFERMQETQKPQNVTQLCQWFTTKIVTELFEGKNITLDKIKIRAFAKEYKHSYSEDIYKKIRGEIDADRISR